MVGVLLGLLSTHQGSGSATMMSVGNIEGRHLGKFACNGVDILLLVDDPERMSETITRSDKVINRFLCRIAGNDSIERLVVGIGEEHGFDVGIVHADVLHAVFLLVATGQLVLLDDTVHVVGHVCTYHQTELRLAIHRLGIDVIVFLLVLHQPSFVLKHLEVLGSLLIDARIVLVGTYRKVYLGLDNMIERHLITLGLGTSFIGVQHVIGA